MPTWVLGISAYYHDSAAALVRDGEVVAAAQEERFSRVKHDARFPGHAVRYCLAEGGVSLRDVAHVVFYDKPLVKFERILETYLACAPRGIRSFLAAMPVWMKTKLFLKGVLRKSLAEAGAVRPAELPPLLFTEHHLAHAASAFFPSPFGRAAVLCLDGVGEWATTTAWLGEGDDLAPMWEIDFPHSLGLLYSAFTHYTGFRVNSGEYKMMGLAPYGLPRYVDRILGRLVDVKEDGTYRLDMRYFDFAAGMTMTNSAFDDLFGGPPRRPGSPLTRRDMDIARSMQDVTEEIVLRLARTLHRETGAGQLCLAGGVALNCVANGRVLREGPYEDVWIQPASGDAGGALGAALAVWHRYCGNPRRPAGDSMRGALLGPRLEDAEIRDCLDRAGAVHRLMDDADLLPFVARLLDEGNVVGWVQGRMEFGPRALGARSILADPRNPRMRSVINDKIKYRESFRPLAPVVLAERAAEWFVLDRPSPYMLFTVPVREDVRVPTAPGAPEPLRIGDSGVRRPGIPAVTHVDHSARVQTVDAGTNPRLHGLLRCFEARTGCPVLVNTSFNIRGEPIVRTAEDAWRCFLRTDMDYLVMGNRILGKNDQPAKAAGSVGPGAAGPGGPTAVGDAPATARKTLAAFGLLAAALIAVLFGLLLPWLRGRPFPAWPWGLASVLCVLALAAPAGLSRAYRAWMAVGSALGWVNARILLGAVFFLIVVPVGAVMRFSGRDPLRRKFEPGAATYRIPSGRTPRERMEVPF